MSETLPNSDVTRQSRIPSRGVQGNGKQRLEDPRNSLGFPLSRKIATPGVIARLMGIDAIPMPLKAADETITLKSPPTSTSTEIKAPFKQAKRSRTGDSMNKMRVLGRSRSRLPHPQEHLLQKIKEDFQSWQASTVAALGNNSKRLDGQIIAQENLRKEKMARYGYGNNKQNECSMKNVVQTSDLGNATEVGVDPKSIRPSQIVLLKPSSDIDADAGELMFGLSKVKRDYNMEKFLQEVKERLQKVKCTSDLRTITWGTEPNNVAQDIATQTKQAATIDLGKRLSRSEAFRSISRAITGAKHASPEHVKINMRNIPRTETVSPKKDDEESVDSFPITSRGRARSLTGTGFDEQTCTSSECLINNNVGKPESKLVRSFSAPESRIRLFFDQSNHGASDIASESGAMTSSFSFRETVSNLRHRFSFRSKLFGRKKKPSFQELYPQFMSPSPSESFRLYNFPQASFAELPPSPVSPLEIVGRNFFSDLNCTLPELSRNCPWEFEASASELSFRTDITVETACIQDKAYLRQVLIAAGLYDNKANGRVARPICDYIFDEVEDLYHYPDRNGGDHGIGLCNSSATDHRMLFDLANEALQILVQGAKTGGQWVIDSTGVSRGRKLVDDVWQQVQALRYPQMQEMQTIDSMVAFEVRKSVWADVLLYEDVYVVGRMIERAIFDELVQDLLLEVFNCEQMTFCWRFSTVSNFVQ